MTVELTLSLIISLGMFSISIITFAFHVRKKREEQSMLFQEHIRKERSKMYDKINKLEHDIVKVKEKTSTLEEDNKITREGIKDIQKSMSIMAETLSAVKNSTEILLEKLMSK